MVVVKKYPMLFSSWLLPPPPFPPSLPFLPSFACFLFFCRSHKKLFKGSSPLIPKVRRAHPSLPPSLRTLLCLLPPLLPIVQKTLQRL